MWHHAVSTPSYCLPSGIWASVAGCPRFLPTGLDGAKKRKIRVLCGRGDRALPQAQVSGGGGLTASGFYRRDTEMQASEPLSSLLSVPRRSAGRSVTALSMVQTWYAFSSGPLLVPPSSDSVFGNFNARYVGTPQRRCEISNYINDKATDWMFLTETWLFSQGDKGKIADLDRRPGSQRLRCQVIPTPLLWGWHHCHFQDQSFSSSHC